MLFERAESDRVFGESGTTSPGYMAVEESCLSPRRRRGPFPVRILYVLYGHRLDNRVQKELAALRAAGHQTFALATSEPGKPSQEVVGGTRVYLRLPRPGGLKGFLRNLYFRVTFCRLPLERELRRLIAEIRPDAIQVADLPGCRSVLDVATPHGIPVVADFHERYPDLVTEWRDMGGLQGIKNRILMGRSRWLEYEYEVLQRAEHVLCTSPAIRQLYVDMGIPAGKLHLVMNTVSLDYFDSVQGKPEVMAPVCGHFVVGYAGGLHPRRGVRVLIEAMSRVHREFPEARLVIVGGGPVEKAIRRRVREIGVNAITLFTGWQPYSTLLACVKAFDVCVLAQECTPHNKLVLSNKVFEYMAAGKPQVVSDCGETARVVREAEAGLLCRPADPQDLAERILELVRDPELRRRLGANGRRAVEKNYDWARSAHELCLAYDTQVVPSAKVNQVGCP